MANVPLPGCQRRSFLWNPSAAELQTTAAIIGRVNTNGIRAPIPGTLQKWLIEDGTQVADGEAVAVIEAMKMETRVSGPRPGRVHIIVEP
ncbi:acetyl-CoA carboxylase biotin carboxyl carrier protein subunit [Mesorhizobium ciceri]|uniref:acetyl-CoA carboxylase biotin carboxyl carrier protein subunit n=1 Tax=Mesorhizobium TaxID=68287 RepID=UPI0007A944A3|nr:hypothetical protein A4R29_05005 [Mesorhizobium ciceri biovar biserrulae]